ncbi:MAG: MATE family efflux transporter [Oscillospiraceae bacterium]|jgi:putative MATE family efflux protein|nr:MATE family efflux transporter [Oscillospiraceae bacterium]
MTKDMTKGFPMKIIVNFCLPLLVGSLFQQLYNMVDAIVVGKFVGNDALAAVGSTGCITFLVFGFVIGLANGFAIDFSQSFGGGNYERMRRFIGNSIILSVGFSIVLTLITVFTARPLLRLMQTPEELLDYAAVYLIIVFSALSATLFVNLINSILRAVGDSKTPLMFLIVGMLLNIGLDLLFVTVFNLAVIGVAVATVIAQILSGALCLLYIRQHHPVLRLSKNDLKPNKAMLLSLLGKGCPMAFQYSITAVGTIIVQAAVNSLGSDIVLVMSVAMRLQLFAIMPFETLGTAMASYCGQNMGARKLKRVKKGIKQAVILALICAVICFIALVFFNKPMSMLFLYEEVPDVVRLIDRYFKSTAVFYPFIALLFVFRNALQGIGYGFLPLLGGVIELGSRILITVCFVGAFGFNAVCFASPLAWILSSVFLVIVYMALRKNMHAKIRRNAIGSGNAA